MRYKIWKDSINTYKILDTESDLISICTNFYALDCIFNVDIKDYIKAEAEGFVNSGDPDDYFAWIAANKVYVKDEIVHSNAPVYYNPFKHPFFRNKHTNKIVHIARSVMVTGNTLSYVK